ncbi:MAG: NADPH-dependent FMN reductase [Armatimonadota bacterium]
MRVIAIAGSLRRGSVHKRLVRAAMTHAPEGMHIEHFDLAPIPLYNMDLEQDPPHAVVELKDRIRAADGLLIAVPEHNYSFSGVTKNAIDWVSRPVAEQPIRGKPVALISAAPGILGGARAQYHLRQVLFYLEARQLHAEYFLPQYREKIDDDGNLLDEAEVERMEEFLAALAGFIGG